MKYFELQPAYGRDYKAKQAVIDAWKGGADFEGDYQLGFKPVNVSDIPKPCVVNLRYKGNRMVASVKVEAA